MLSLKDNKSCSIEIFDYKYSRSGHILPYVPVLAFSESPTVASGHPPHGPYTWSGRSGEGV